MNHKFIIIDYLVLALILMISIFIGLYQVFKTNIKNIKNSFSQQIKKQNNEIDYQERIEFIDRKNKLNEYLIANSSISSFPIALSLLASFYSATGILGVPAEIYQYGILFVTAIFGFMVTPLIGAFITGPLFSNLKTSSMFEYLEARYKSKRVRQVGMICYIIRSFISSSIYIYGPATSLNLFIKINENLSIGLIGFIATFYTCIGGIKAVIYTDLFQVIVMFLSLLLLIGKGIFDVGGLKNLWHLNSKGGRLNFFELDPDPFIRQSTWSLFFGSIALYSNWYCFDQQMIQRFQAAKSKKAAQRALLLNIPGVFIITSLCCLLGLILYGIYYDCDPLTSGQIANPNQLVSLFVMNNLKIIPGASGLFLGGLVCASLSSLSSSLNSQSAIIWSDLLKSYNYFNKFNDLKSLRVNQLIVLVCGFVSTIFAYLISSIGGNIFQISSSVNGALMGPMIGLFSLGMIFKGSNKYGAIIGTIFGFFTGCFLIFGAYVIKPVYPKLDLSIKGCNISNSTSYNFDLKPNLKNSNISFSNRSEFRFEKIFYISYMWNTVLSIIATLIVGLFTSFLSNIIIKIKKNFMNEIIE